MKPCRHGYKGYCPTCEMVDTAETAARVERGKCAAEIAAAEARATKAEEERDALQRDMTFAADVYRNTLATMVQRESYQMREQERDAAREALAKAHALLDTVASNCGCMEDSAAPCANCERISDYFDTLSAARRCLGEEP